MFKPKVAVPTIGFLARGLEPNDTYNRKSWGLACELAAERGCNLLMVAGSFINAPGLRDNAHLAVFRLLNSGLVDGALLSQTVVNRANEDEMSRLDRDMPRVPLVALSIPLGTRPCVRVDNEPGLRKILQHLIRDHGCRRIVHVRGPHPNAEATHRESLWREELERAGIQPEPSWLVQGDYDYSGLQTIGQDILDQVGTNFDAVFACNDTAALRVLADLQSLGRKVPEDHRVVGFDDIQSGQYSHPALTTVSQPLDPQLRRAWNDLDRLLKGTLDSTEVWIETRPTIRASCGCPASDQTPGAYPLLEVEGDLPSVVSRNEARMEAFQWAVYDLNNFLRAMNRVSNLEDLPMVLREWLPTMGLKSFAIMRAADDHGVPMPHRSWVPEGSVLPTAPPTFHVLCSWPEQGLIPGTVLTQERFSLRRWLEGQTPSVHGIFPLVVGDTWHGLGVFELHGHAGLLELTLQEQLASVLDRIERERLHLETTAEARAKALIQTEGFRSLKRLVAEVAHEINTPLGAIVSSISTLESALDHFGPADLEWISSLGPSDLKTLTVLASGIGATLPSLSPTEVRHRRSALKEALVREGVQQVDEVAEGLMSLGFEDPSAWLPVSKTPQFEAVVTFLTRVQDLPVAAKIVGRAAEKITRFVKKLRASAVEVEGAGLTLCGLQESLETTIMLLPAEMANALVTEGDWPGLPPVWGRSDELTQIWINLVRNGFQALTREGTVTIRAARDGNRVRIDVTDTGRGIAPENQSKIFLPFFSTKPQGEGMGLGLDITRRIIEGCGGSISFVSTPGLTTFSVWLIAGDSAAPKVTR